MLTKKLKLSTLSEAVLKDKEMNAIIGGIRKCGCSCRYQGQSGGSALNNNSTANYYLGDGGGYSPEGCNYYATVEFDNGPVFGYDNKHLQE